MTDREVMKMALEALEDSMYPQKKQFDAIVGLKQALAQEQTKCPRCGEVSPAEIHTCSPQVAQPEQEPVAYLYHDTACAELANPLADSTLLVLACDRKPNGRNETPLYAAPPSKEWVGLTVEEIKEILYGLLEDDRTPMLTLVNVVEAKLKEKNA